MITKDITTESWREYDFNGRVYTILKPVSLSYREGGTTHRIVDEDGITHCLPAPGTGDCVLRWKGNPAVSF
jgi:hypothetical protein